MLPLALSACGGGGGGGGSGSSTPSLTKSTITASPSTVTADGTAEANFRVTLKDSSGNTISGSSANVNVTAKPCGNCDFDWTDNNGKVTGTLASQTAQKIVLSFTINGKVASNTATVSFVAGTPAPSDSRITLTVPGGSGTGTPTAPADGFSPLIATVTLYDADGNREKHGGASVQITSAANVGPVTDNGDGTYSAPVTSVAAKSVSVLFSVDGRTDLGATASGTFSAPPQTEASAYAAPWSVKSCDSNNQCSMSGVYEADVSSPSASATQIAAGKLMGQPDTAPATVIVERATLDPSTGKMRLLGPGELVYAQGGTLYRLDLTRPGAAPKQLSTLAPTVVCGLFAVSPYNKVYRMHGGAGIQSVGQPTWIGVRGFAASGKTPADCQSGTPSEWLVPADGNAGTTPMAIGGSNPITAVVGALVQPDEGKTTSLIVQSGTSLAAYPANLAYTGVALSGVTVPSGGRVTVLGAGMSPDMLVDVSSVSSGTRMDGVYRLRPPSATQVTSLSVSSANGYLSNCIGGSSPAQDYTPLSARGVGGTVYFDYPNSSGFDVDAIADGATSKTTVYQDSSASYECDGISPGANRAGRLYAATDGKLALLENSTSGANWRLVSVSASGSAGQTPTVLANEYSGSMQLKYYSEYGDTLWLDAAGCTTSGCSTKTQRVIATTPGGATSNSFSGVTIGGDVQQGISAQTGNTFRKYVATAPKTGASCTSSGWKLYDASTLNAVASPSFGASDCVNGLYMYGPNDSFLFGSVDNGSGVDAYGLFGPGGSLKKFASYAPPGSGYTVSVVALF